MYHEFLTKIKLDAYSDNLPTLKSLKRVQFERTCSSGSFKKKFDVQGSSSSNDHTGIDQTLRQMNIQD